MSQLDISTDCQSSYNMQEPLTLEQVARVVQSEARHLISVLFRARVKLEKLSNRQFSDFVMLRIKFSTEVDRYTATTQENRRLELTNLMGYFRASSLQPEQWIVMMDTQWQNKVTPGELITTFVWRARQTLFFMGVGQFEQWASMTIDGAIQLLNGRNKHNPRVQQEIRRRQQSFGSEEAISQNINRVAEEETEQTRKARKDALQLLQGYAEPLPRAHPPRVERREVENQPNRATNIQVQPSQEYFPGLQVQEERGQRMAVWNSQRSNQRRVKATEKWKLYQDHAAFLINERQSGSSASSEQDVNRRIRDGPRSEPTFGRRPNVHPS